MTAVFPDCVMVTGASGFVGQHLVPALRTSFPGATIHTAKIDLVNESEVAAAIRTLRPDACVHLAAVSSIPSAHTDPVGAWRINLGGTLTLTRALAAEAPGCTLLFASTADAYGRSFKAGVLLDETAALNPINTYGATKAAADLALGAMADNNLRIIRARPFNHTGPGQSEAFVVAAFARQIARVAAGLQPAVLRVGALDPRRDILDVRDVCSFYVRCLKRASHIPSGSIINVASGVPRRMGDVLNELLELAGIRVQIEVDASLLRPAEIETAGGDATKARDLLDWEPVLNWRHTLGDVLADWKSRIETTPR